MPTVSTSTYKPTSPPPFRPIHSKAWPFTLFYNFFICHFDVKIKVVLKKDHFTTHELTNELNL